MPSKFRQYATVLRSALRHGHEDRWILLGYVVLSIIAALTEGASVTLLIPILQSMGSSEMFGNIPILREMSGLFGTMDPVDRLKIAASAMSAVVILRGFLQYSVELSNYWIPLRIERRLRMRSFRLFMAANIPFTSSLSAGEIANLTSNAPTRVGIVLRFLCVLVSSGLILLIYLGLMMLVSVWMTIGVVIFVVTASLCIKWISSGPLRRASGVVTKATEVLGQIFHEALTGIKIIRLSRASGMVEYQARTAVDNLIQAQTRHVAIQSLMSPFFSTAAGLVVCVMIYAVAVSGAGENSGAVANVVLFVFLLFRVLTPVTVINTARSIILMHVEALHELENYFLLASKQAEQDGTKPFTILKDSIKFEGVSFTYPGRNEQALTDVSFTLPRHQTTAIVGLSGSGKSTVAALLSRLYRPDCGRVLVDETDLNEIRSDDWWRSIGVVSQDIFLINDSVFRNITYGIDPLPTLDEVRAAAKIAEADEFIMSLPQRYDTNLGQLGSRLSGGQRQRIALARVLLRQPDILILDEATSALDSITEHTIQSAVETLCHGKTLIVIAHRLSTVRRADNIIVMENGKIAEQGTHSSLLANRGIYWKLVTTQSVDAEKH